MIYSLPPTTLFKNPFLERNMKNSFICELTNQSVPNEKYKVDNTLILPIKNANGKVLAVLEVSLGNHLMGFNISLSWIYVHTKHKLLAKYLNLILRSVTLLILTLVMMKSTLLLLLHSSFQMSSKRYITKEPLLIPTKWDTSYLKPCSALHNPPHTLTLAKRLRCGHQECLVYLPQIFCL